MTPRRSTHLARGLGSFLLLALLLVGAPFALATLVGWPLPSGLPDIPAVEQSLRSGVSDDVIVKSLALVGWLAWLQIAVAIVAEVAAVVRGRPSIHLPVLPGVQATAGRLVASVAMMTATLSPAAAMAAPAPVPVVATYSAPPPVAVPPPAWLVSSVATPDLAQSEPVSELSAPAATVTVERHDSYWAIAERTLGDGYRWSEIRDLNVGRTMNTGDVVQAGSDLVHPGWVLELPADAAAPEQPVAAVGEAEPLAELIVEPGDNFWSLAEAQLAAATGEEPTDVETAPYWQDMIEANEDRLVQPGNPNLIVPGQALCIPTVPGALPAGGPAVVPAPPATVEPEATEPPVPVETPPAPQPEVAETAPADAVPVPPPPPAVPPPTATETLTRLEPTAEPTPSESADDSSARTIAAGLASAALAVGATRAVRRRRRQAGHRAPSSVPRPTADEARDLHKELLADADDVAVDDLRRRLGDLAQALAVTGGSCRPRIVQHGSDHLDVFLDRPSEDAPPGWKAQADGAVWSLRDTKSAAGEGEAICAAPLMVTLGQPDDGGQLYLDLETEGVVALVGDPVAARGVARAMLTELAFTPLADTLEVLVVGDLAPPDATTLDHVTLAESWDDVCDDLTEWVAQTHDAIAENGWPNAFVARGHDPDHDALAPVVVIASEPPPTELVEQLGSHPLSTLTVVAVGAIEGATTIECQPDSLTVVDLGLVCTPYPLEAEVLDLVIDLVEDAEAVPEAGAVELPMPPPLLVVEPSADGPDSSLEEPEYEILVRVLGDIRIDGGAPLPGKHIAVVTYIALHGTVSADRLEDAVWASPTAASRRKRLANTMSDCRAALGRMHFPPASDGNYRTGPGVVTDIDLFELRVKRAAEQPPVEAVETLLSALELVTGPPFTYGYADRGSFAWVELENWISRWELKVAAVAQHCAEMLLDFGRNDEAVEAALHALGIIPTHTGLTETLMRGHAANGDRLAVRSVYQDHVMALRSLELEEAAVSTADLLMTLLRVTTV